MIDLGLKRIRQLLKNQTRFPWHAIHVAGTNGKGSVCAYISSIFHEAGIPCGRFTSPHLVDRWDCITLGGATVDKNVFLEAEATVKATDTKLGIGATEFEILTATAFEIFSRQKVDVAVVEVGMGGRLDSTNVFESPLATVITRIGMDHMGFLGSTLEEIAREKAGIMKKGAPCVIDGSNPQEVLSVLHRTGEEVGTGKFVVASSKRLGDGHCEIETSTFGILQFKSFLAGNYQPSNLSCAINVLALVREQFPMITEATIHKGICATKWPGRMEMIDVSSIAGRRKSVLVDGAHNPQAADALAEYVNLQLRTAGKESIVWVLAASQGKDIGVMLHSLLKPGDDVFAIGFGPVDGMPWVVPTNPLEIMEAAKEVVGDQGSAASFEEDTKEVLSMACHTAGKRNVVVAGSLYLVGDVIRLARCN